MRAFQFTVALLLGLGLGGAAHAQAPVIISGTVTDAKSGESLLGASVVLRGAGVGTSAELEGFALRCPAAARPDTLVVTYLGYRPRRLVLTPTADARLAIRLQAASQVQLSQVEVTAKRPIAEDFVLQELSYLQIVTNPAAAADPLLAVRTLPAASSTDESASISLRGSDPSQTGIYLNSAPIYDAVKFAQLNGIGTFSIFNPNLVKSLLVFPSNPPLEYGNAGAGLIGISTDDKRQAPALEVGVGLANSGFFAGLPVGKKGMLKAYGNYQSGQLLRALNPRAFRDLTSLHLGDGGLHYATRLGRGGTLKLFGYGIREQYGYHYVLPALTDTYRYSKLRGLLVGSYEQVFSRADLSVSHMLSRSGATTGVGNYRTRLTDTDWFGSVAYRYYWSEAVSSRVGVSADHRGLRVAGQFPIYPYALAETAPVYADTITRRRTLWEASHYTKVKVGALVLGAGLRYGRPQLGLADYLSYQGNLRYNFSPRQFLNLSGGQYHAVATPEPAAIPFQLTRSRQLALDYSYSGPAATVTLAAYAKRESGPAQVRIVGAEAYVQHAFSKQLTGDLSVASVRVLTATAERPADAGPFYSPSRRNLPYNLKSNWQLALPWLNAGAFGQYRAGAPYTPVVGSRFEAPLNVFEPLYAAANSGRLPHYFRLDLSVNRQFALRQGHSSLLAYAVLNNVLNTGNVSSYTYNADYSAATPAYFQRRSVYAGIILTLK